MQALNRTLYRLQNAGFSLLYSRQCYKHCGGNCERDLAIFYCDHINRLMAGVCNLILKLENEEVIIPITLVLQAYYPESEYKIKIPKALNK